VEGRKPEERQADCALVRIDPESLPRVQVQPRWNQRFPGFKPVQSKLNGTGFCRNFVAALQQNAAKPPKSRSEKRLKTLLHGREQPRAGVGDKYAEVASEWAVGCHRSCDRWGHPSLDCVEHNVQVQLELSFSTSVPSGTERQHIGD
jgi:hypothetical protein